MNLTIQLPDQLSDELRREAARHGIAPDEYAAQLIQNNLPVAERVEAARLLFNQWSAEDATSDTAEITRRQAEWETLKKSLNENRASGRKLFVAVIN